MAHKSLHAVLVFLTIYCSILNGGAAIVVNSSGDADPPPPGVITLRKALTTVTPGNNEIEIDSSITDIFLTKEIAVNISFDFSITSYLGTTIHGHVMEFLLCGHICELNKLTFKETLFISEASGVDVFQCNFHGNSTIAGGLGAFNLNNSDNPAVCYTGILDILLTECEFSDTAEDGFQAINESDDIRAIMQFCESNNNGDDGYELEQNNSGGIYGSAVFCHSDRVGLSDAGANYNILQSGFGDNAFTITACTVKNASDTNIEFKSLGTGDLVASVYSVTVFNNIVGEGIEFRGIGEGAVSPGISTIDIVGANAQGVQIISDLGTNNHYHSFHFFDMDISNSGRQGVELEIKKPGGMELFVSGGRSQITDNNSHAFKLEKTKSGEVFYFNFYNCEFRFNEKDGVNATLSHNAVKFSSTSFSNSDFRFNAEDGIDLTVAHPSDVKSDCSLDSIGYYQSIDLNPTPQEDPNNLGIFTYWAPNAVARNLMGL